MTQNFTALSEERHRTLMLCQRQDGELAYLRRRVGCLKKSRDPDLTLLLPTAMAQLDELRTEAAQAAKELTRLTKALKKAIEKQPREPLRRLLRYRHLELLTWREIGVLMELDPRWLMRQHKRAVEELNRLL